jgi:hypothetical protein
VPVFAAPACAKRRITLHPIVDPAVTSDLYWAASRARQLSSTAQGFNAFLRVYFSELAEQRPSPSDRAAPRTAATG